MAYANPFFEGKSRFVRLVFLLLFVAGGSLVFSSLGMLVAYAAYGTMDMSKAAGPAGFIRITQFFSSLGMFAVPALVFAFCSDRKWLPYNAMDRKPHFLLVDTVLLLSFVLLPIVAVLGQWNHALKLPECMSAIEQKLAAMEMASDRIMYLLTAEHSYAALALNVLVMALCPALFEEMLFRGTVQGTLMRWGCRPHSAIWATALLFAVVHFEYRSFLPILLLGGYLGYLFYWGRSLWLPVLAHFLHNALTVVVDFTFRGRGIDIGSLRFTDVRGAVPLAVTCTVVAVMGLVFMWRVQKDLREGNVRQGGNNRRI